MTEPLKKGEMRSTDAPRKPWPTPWRLLDWLSRAFVPLLLIAIIAGFEAAIFVRIFDYVWSVFR